MKKLIAVFLLMSMLLVLFTGCGKSTSADSADVSTVTETEENSDSGDSSEQSEEVSDGSESGSEESADSGSSGGGESRSAGDYINVENAKDVLAAFKEFGYVYNTKKDGTETSFSFNYVELGSENINGTDTVHYKVTQVEKGETKEFEAWYDSELSAVKYKNADGEKTGMEASMAGMPIGMMVQMYCNLNGINATFMNEDGTVNQETAEVKETKKESMDLGNGAADVEISTVAMKFGDYNKVLGVTKINGKKVYVVLESVSKDNTALEGLRLTRLVPR